MSSLPELMNGNALTHDIPLESGKGLAGKGATSAVLAVLNRTMKIKQITVDMADAAHALVLGPAATAQTRLDGAILLVDPNSSGTAEVLTYADSESNLSGLINLIVNTGGENITINNDGASAVGTVPAGGAAWVICDGANLRVHNILAGSDLDLAKFSLLAATTLTIASGAVAYTRSNHAIDTEAAAASDDLDTITGGVEGDILFLRANSAARTVVLKHTIGANKIATPCGQDIQLTDAEDLVVLFHNGTQWIVACYSTLVGNNTIADPGNGGAIPVTRSGICDLTSAGAGETRTLANPTFRGQRIALIHGTDGGGIAVTVASAINQTGNTVITLNEAGDFIELVGVNVASAWRWRVVVNDGCALT